MKKLILLLLTITAFGQAPTKNANGFYAGTSSMNSSALGQFDSTTKGFLGPRMTTTQRNAISSPATGLQIYNTTTNVLNVYNGSAWVEVGSGGSGSTPNLQAVATVGNTITSGASTTTIDGSQYSISESGNDTFLYQGALEFNSGTSNTQYGIGGIQLTDGAKQAVYDIDQLAYTTSTGTLIVAHGTQTANHTATFPNKTGTVAMTSDIPTNVSELANDSGYITSADLPNVSGLVPYTGASTNLDLGANSLEANSIITNNNGFTKRMILSANNVAIERFAEWQDKDYAGIADITDIPTLTSQLTNDSGFITTIPSGIDATKIGAGTVSNTEFGYIDGVTSSIQTQLNSKASKVSITGNTKTKITYNADGIVTAGADATTADIADSTDKRYVTDAQLALFTSLQTRISQSYNVSGAFSGTSPADNATYYFGPSSGIIATTETSRRWKFPYATTIRTVSLSLGQTTAGSNESISIYLRNSTAGTETLIGTFTSDFTAGTGAHFNFSGLSIAIPNTTDYWTFKMVCPTWGTNPTAWTGTYSITAN